MVKTPQMHFNARPDWPSAIPRWRAFWERQPTDRPCLAIKAPRPASAPKPALPANLAARWMDPDYLAAVAKHYFASTCFFGEAVPVLPHLMAGTVTGCGVNVGFADGAIEIKPCMSGMAEPAPWRPGPDDCWRPRLEKILERLLDVAAGNFMLGYLEQYPVNDLLALLRGASDLMLDLADEPEACLNQLKALFPLWLEDHRHFRSLVDRRQTGCGAVLWSGTWAPFGVKSAQSDMSLMISSEMFDRFVLPELDMLAEHFDCLWYHTCGCKRHLASLLSRPYIRAFQYSPNPQEPPNGPAHMEFYRSVQAAGRCLDIAVGDRGSVEYVIRHLRPDGLVIHTGAADAEDARQLLDNAVKWAGSHCRARV